MVGELAARHALPKEVIDGVTERTGGVPLFVEEVTRLLLERGEQPRTRAILTRGAAGGRKLHTGEFAVRPSRERYASHLDATRSGNLAKFTAMRRASPRVSRLLMAGLCCSSSK
jgi:hypothetical protein